MTETAMVLAYITANYYYATPHHYTTCIAVYYHYTMCITVHYWVRNICFIL